MTAKARQEKTKEPAADIRPVVRAPTVLDGLRKRYGLDWPTLAGVLGASDATLADWQKGTAAPDAASLEKMHRAEEILKGLARVMKKEFIAVWLSRPHNACGGRAPLELLREGAYETVENLVYFLEAGEPV